MVEVNENGDEVNLTMGEVLDFAKIGLEFVLVCSIVGETTGQVMDRLLQQIESEESTT